jgi:hypothetical protein
VAITSRFGLTLGSALTDHDKALIDAVLSAIELHDHTGGTRLSDPSGPPVGVMETTGGSLPAGATYYYRLSYVDKFGLETAATVEAAFTTPGPAAVPSTPTAAVIDGGLLSVGVYYYGLSAVDVDGNQTMISIPATATITTNNSSVNVTGRTFSAGTASYNVWRQGPRTSTFVKIGEITDPTVVFLDNGYVPDDPLSCDPTAIPPAGNTTNATSLITFTPADPIIVAADGGPIKAWRLYRSTTSGSYPVNSLLTEVNTTVNQDGTGGLLLDFTDDGTTALLAGQPKEVSETLNPSKQIVAGSSAAGGATILPPSPDGTLFRLIVADDGSLVTRVSPGGYYSANAGALVLRSTPSSVQWKLTITNDGQLVTDQALAVVGDTLYPYGDGPDLPSPDPTVHYKLGVLDDGTLTTTQV